MAISKQNQVLMAEFKKREEIERCERAVIEAADVCERGMFEDLDPLEVAVLALRSVREI